MLKVAVKDYFANFHSKVQSLQDANQYWFIASMNISQGWVWVEKDKDLGIQNTGFSFDAVREALRVKDYSKIKPVSMTWMWDKPELICGDVKLCLKNYVLRCMSKISGVGMRLARDNRASIGAIKVYDTSQVSIVDCSHLNEVVWQSLEKYMYGIENPLDFSLSGDRQLYYGLECLGDTYEFYGQFKD